MLHMNGPSYKLPRVEQDRLKTEQLDALADTMFALAAPSRLQILMCLRAGPLTVSEIITAVGMEQSAVSHQLRVLRDHAVVSVERRGRERLYGLRDSYVAALLDDGLGHVLALEGGDQDAPASAGSEQSATGDEGRASTPAA